MAHFVGINEGPVLDWTDDNSLMEHFRKWKKKVEILFKGPLNNANDPVKCNYIIYHLVKLEWNSLTNGKLRERSMIETGIALTGILNLLQNILHPNALIATVELKRLFQGSMSLEGTVVTP